MARCTELQRGALFGELSNCQLINQFETVQKISIQRQLVVFLAIH